MKIFKVVVSSLVIMVICSTAFAAESRKKELIDSVDYATKVLENKGKAGMEELKSYRFAEGEGYVYLTNMDFFVIMHPAKELVGKDFTAIRDAKGTYFQTLKPHKAGNKISYHKIQRTG